MRQKVKKTIASILISCFMILFIGTITTKAVATLELSVDSVEGVKKGDTITLKIKASNVAEQESKISGIKFDAYYDTENLEFVSAEKLDAASGGIDLNENYPEEGRVRIGIVSLTGLNKSGELYEVTLKAKENITKSEVEIRIETKEVVDSNNNEIPCETKNGTIKFAESAISNPENTEEKTAPSVEENNDESKTQENTSNETIEDKKEIKLSKQETKNLKEILNENSGINPDTKLTYKVENLEVAEIDEEGNITPKQEGTTNIEITDEEGNTITIPLIVTESEVNTQTEEEGKNNQIAIYILVTIVILIVIAVIVKFLKRGK